MGISCAEFLRRTKKVSSKGAMQALVHEELLKEEDTLRILKEQDLLEGDIYGNGTTDTYAWSDYSMFKKQLNPRAGGKVDLILTGAFIDSFFLPKPKDTKYLFGATDKKKSKLTGQYGTDIMGLNQEVFTKFQKEIILLRFIRSLKKTTNTR